MCALCIVSKSFYVLQQQYFSWEMATKNEDDEIETETAMERQKETNDGKTNMVMYLCGMQFEMITASFHSIPFNNLV